jgi:hypothetical protein
MFPQRIPRVLALSGIVLLASLACNGDDGTGPPTVVTVDLRPDSAQVQAGATFQFTATALNSVGDPIQGVTFTWTTGDPSLATVDDNGLATGVVMGVTSVRATASGVFDASVLSVVPNANRDLPDDNFLDNNGDGIDGEIARAIFVAPAGSDANPGTMEQPKRSITSAIAAVVADGTKSEVYVAAGTYSETIELVEGVSIYGGYSATSWSRSFTNVATIEGDTIAMSGTSITQAMVIDLLTVESADNTTGAGNSTGIYLADSEGISLRNLTIVAGNGGNGSAGTNGLQGRLGNDGAPGAITAGGAGGDTVMVGGIASGKGGDGGNGAATITLAGGNGGDGLPQPGGGMGGNGGPVPDPNPDNCGIDGFGGDLGTAGAGGLDGSPGAGGDGQGTVLGGYWLGSRGDDGTVGTPGFGGGAGGGGSAGREPTCQAIPGGGGGGGGSGGQVGDEGGGGGGGGGSFGVFAFNSSVTIENSTITAGDGGTGGAGGTGGPGGPGGAGGIGSNGDVGQAGMVGGRGGDGGAGGAGGDGGVGGGGGGGISYAVYSTGTSGVTLDAQTTLTAGTGGAGGAAPGTGNDGAQGDSGEKNF